MSILLMIVLAIVFAIGAGIIPILSMVGPGVWIGEMLARLNFAIAQLATGGNKLYRKGNGVHELRPLDVAEPERNLFRMGLAKFGLDYDRDADALGDSVVEVETVVGENGEEQVELPDPALGGTFRQFQQRQAPPEEGAAATDGGSLPMGIGNIRKPGLLDKVPVDIQRGGIRTFLDPRDVDEPGVLVNLATKLEQHRDSAGLDLANRAYESAMVEHAGDTENFSDTTALIMWIAMFVSGIGLGWVFFL